MTKFLTDGLRTYGAAHHYVRAWRAGKGRSAETVVQIWLNRESPIGEPDGDWAMPGGLPVEVAIDQAVLQTK